jgi:TonB family protein
MHLQRIGAKAHKACSVWVLIAGLGSATGAGTAWAQAAPAASGTGAPSEALQRQALSPYRFILQNANAPTRAAPKPAVASAPAPAPEPAKRPAAVEQASASPRPSAAPPPAAPVAEPPKPEPVAALTPKVPEPIVQVRREIIPVRTDEPRLPAALMRERPSGVVRVHFDLNPDGSTGNVKVVSSTNRALNRASVDAVQGWKFQPVDEVLTIETELAYKYD